MRRNGWFIVLASLATAMGLGGCQSAESASTIHQAVAVIGPTKGQATSGWVSFTQTEHGVKVMAEVEGLRAKAKHGFHIHEFGDLRSVDGTSAGGHYNPEGHAHALAHEARRHAGDLGNLEADENGRARYEALLTNVSINGSKNPILGRAVIVHVKEDDGGQPVGNAGARIGQGTIGIAGAPAKK